VHGGNLKSYLHLHLIVFIWGFTAVLGRLISLPETALVWYRMLLATAFLLIYVAYSGKTLRLPLAAAGRLLLVGCMIAVHWIFFFKAIKISNVSVTLAMFSAGAFFGSLLEPLLYGRKMLLYEVALGLVVIGALTLIVGLQWHYFAGALCALFSVLMGVLFTLANGKLTQIHDPAVLTTYEFSAGFALVSIYLALNREFSAAFFDVGLRDWILLGLLASVCTAYAFTASVHVMKKLTPYTVVLTTNLEPVYGILLAYFLIGGDERMGWTFYVGAALVVAAVVANGVIKQRLDAKKAAG